MTICKLCNSKVVKFKSGSHIVPRWALKLTKQNGRNIKLIDNSSHVNQTDRKTEAWCANCETSFTFLDTIGADFFKHQKNYLGSETDNSIPLTFEAHSWKNYEKISEFVASIFVREFLDLNKNNDTYSKHYKPILSRYQQKKTFYIIPIKFSKLRDAVQEPEYTGLHDLPFRLMLNGYLIYLFTKRSDLPPEFNIILNQKNLLIPVHDRTDDGYTQSMFTNFSRKKF